LDAGDSESPLGSVATTPKPGVTVENILAELTTLGVALGATLGATFVIELRHRADRGPIGVLTDRRPRLRLPLFMGGFRSVPRTVGSPEHPSKPAWHPYFAAPRFLLPVRHSPLLSVGLILRRSQPAPQTAQRLAVGSEAQAEAAPKAAALSLWTSRESAGRAGMRY
jgi:hypothetical protein